MFQDVTPECVQQHTAEQIVHVPIPQFQEQIVDNPVPPREHVTPRPAVTFSAPAPVIEDVTPAPGVPCATAFPVIEHVAPAPVKEYTAPAPPSLRPVSSYLQHTIPFKTNSNDFVFWN